MLPHGFIHPFHWFCFLLYQLQVLSLVIEKIVDFCPHLVYVFILNYFLYSLWFNYYLFVCILRIFLIYKYFKNHLIFIFLILLRMWQNPKSYYVFFFSRGALTVFGDIFAYYDWAWGKGSIGIRWAEARNAATCPKVHQQLRRTENYLAHHRHGAEVDMPDRDLIRFRVDWRGNAIS